MSSNIDLSDLNEEKARLFQKMDQSDETMYITGKAGSGKSYLLDFFVKHTHKNVAVVAPTGIAALNVGGQTIHSFFALDFGVQNIDDIRRKGVFGKRKTILQKIDTLVIDEASMVRVDILDAIDVKLQLANENHAPFGGKQVILFGDLYQLPPVVEAQVNRYLDDKYKSIFFFKAPVFNRIPLKMYELKDIFRQKDDPTFIAILNGIRVGQITDDMLDALNARCVPHERSVGKQFLTLAPRNETVSRINQNMLDKISRPEYSYEARIEGDFKQSAYPTEATLKLKVGAQVIMLKNDSLDDKQGSGNTGRRWVNGTLGVISELTPNTVKVMINGVEHSIDRVSWDKNEYSYDAVSKKLVAHPVASFTQFPIRLAWALTIHKAQGQTYKSVEVDLEGGAFDSGQTYVALSRCVSLKNLYLAQPISRDDIIVNQEIVNFMNTTPNLLNEASATGDDIASKRAELLRQLAELDSMEEQERLNAINDVRKEDDSELRFESDYDDRPPDYNDDPLGSRNDYKPYYNTDYLLSTDKEDNTPDGWPDTFYEY